MKVVSSLRVALVVLTAACTEGRATAWCDEERVITGTRWEYRVLTKEQLLELGKKDMAAGLNNLGDDGGELFLVDGAYLLKRPRLQIQKQAAEIQRRINAIIYEVVRLRDRVAWAERMLQKGYVTEQQMAAEKLRLREAQAELAEAREALKALPAGSNPAVERLPMPGK
jgi:hypothetical protein